MAASLRHICVSTTKYHFMHSTLTRCMYPSTYTCTRNLCIQNTCMKFDKRCYSNEVDFFGLEENELQNANRNDISADPVSGSKRKLKAKSEKNYFKSNEAIEISKLPHGGSELIHQTPFGSIRYDRNPGNIQPKYNPASGLKIAEKSRTQNLLSDNEKIQNGNRQLSHQNDVQNSFIDEQYFPTMDEKKSVGKMTLVSEEIDGSSTKLVEVEVNKSKEALSHIDDQYFGRSESPSSKTSFNPRNLDESEEGYQLQQDNDRNSSSIDNNLLTSKHRTNEDYKVDLPTDPSFVDQQYFEYSDRGATIDKHTEVSNSDQATVTADDKDMHSFIDEQYFGNNKDGIGREPNDVLSNLNQYSKQKKKQTKLSKFKFNFKEMDKTEGDDKEKSVHSVSKKIRAENEKITKSMLYGQMDPREYDSKGFRILTGQVPDFRNIPSIDIVKVLRGNIIYDNNDVLAITKPYGLPSQGGPGVQNSIAQLLNDILPSQELHHVHRLDKETTGVMLFGKTPEMAKKLRNLFAQREIKKRYLVITKNIPSLSAGIIDIPMSEGTVDTKTRMVLRPYNSPELDPIMRKCQPGKEAKTEYHVLDQGEQCALIECQPLTGLKHQIRVHLSFGLNCPILGDHKYSHMDKIAPMRLHPGMLKRLKIRQSKVRTLAMHLHARSILIPEFQDGKNLFISAPLPSHFLKNMSSLKLTLPRGK